MQATVDPNGGLYDTGCPAIRWRHWPARPSSRTPTSSTGTRSIPGGCGEQIASVNLAADYLATLDRARGAVRGAGYYVERPTRIESDGVAQCHAVDAFRRVAALNRVLGDETRAGRLRADRPTASAATSPRGSGQDTNLPSTFIRRAA